MILYKKFQLASLFQNFKNAVLKFYLELERILYIILHFQVSIISRYAQFKFLNTHVCVRVFLIILNFISHHIFSLFNKVSKLDKFYNKQFNSARESLIHTRYWGDLVRLYIIFFLIFCLSKKIDTDFEETIIFKTIKNTIKEIFLFVYKN